MAIDRDTTRGDGETGLFDAFDLPDLSLPASDGAVTGSALDDTAATIDAKVGPPLGNASRTPLVNGFDGSGDDHTRVTRMAYGRHLRVLLVESDPNQAESFRRAADESVLDVRVEHVVDEASTLARLEKASGHLIRRPLPDVIVMSLPTADTHRLLEILKLDERFEDMPILVLSKAADPVAERRSFSLGATAHLVAPRRDYERVALVHALPDFIPWARAAHAHLEAHRR